MKFDLREARWLYWKLILLLLVGMACLARCERAPAEDLCAVDFSQFVEEWRHADMQERVQVADAVRRGHPHDCVWFDPRPECRE